MKIGDVEIVIRATLRAASRFPETVRGEASGIRWDRAKEQTRRELEQEAVQVIRTEWGGVLYELPGRRFVRFDGWSVGLVLPVSEADAEDLYGWTPARR